MTTTAQPDSLTRLIEHHAGTKPVPSGPEGLRVCDLPEYLTIKDAADLIDVKPWPIYRVVEQGRVRAFRHAGRFLVSRHDVESLDVGVLRAGIDIDG